MSECDPEKCATFAKLQYWAQDGISSTKPNSLVRIVVVLPRDVPTGRALLGVFGFGNLVLIGAGDDK